MIRKLAVAGAAVVALLASFIVSAQPAQAATGFYVSGGRLYDANGNDFVMRGVSHPYAWYPQQNSSFADIKALGANTVRVVLDLNVSSAGVANVISLCRANRLVCMLEIHNTTGYGENAGAVSLARAAEYWVNIRGVLTGQEPYVLINIGNEPYGNTNTGGWTADTQNAIRTLRAAGLSHTLVVDAPNWGQDWQGVMRSNAAAVFAGDVNRNTVFSIHMYGVYGQAATINNYLNAFVGAGLPIIVGEFGFNHSDG
ncbi:MAG TPA: cellulase family glycosylhydrolase, partial [Actinoplanes sp.]